MATREGKLQETFTRFSLEADTLYSEGYTLEEIMGGLACTLVGKTKMILPIEQVPAQVDVMIEAAMQATTVVNRKKN